MSLPPDPLAALCQARRDPELALIEGFHALKHALRFGAEILCAVITDAEQVRTLARAHAPEIPGRLPADTPVIAPERVQAAGLKVPLTGVLAVARRPPVDIAGTLADPHQAPIVLLEHPRDLGNIGACVRVAAAADVAGVLTTGIHDPWESAALRGSAGLHFALPVAHLGADPLARVRTARATPEGARPLVAVDPDGEELRPARLPARAILAFGAERQGLSPELLALADIRVRLPMRAGVSSLNLATSVSALLYSRLLSAERD